MSKRSSTSRSYPNKSKNTKAAPIFESIYIHSTEPPINNEIKIESPIEITSNELDDSDADEEFEMPSAIDLTGWMKKYNISREAADDLLTILDKSKSSKTSAPLQSTTTDDLSGRVHLVSDSLLFIYIFTL